eukprot:9045482-Pyramimonas_sp.AAC.1
MQLQPQKKHHRTRHDRLQRMRIAAGELYEAFLTEQKSANFAANALRQALQVILVKSSTDADGPGHRQEPRSAPYTRKTAQNRSGEHTIDIGVNLDA